jgi:SPP1 family phage portal protein
VEAVVTQLLGLHGRRVIESSATEVTRDNVADIIASAMVTHNKNSAEIEYLWNYYRGLQPILSRIKEVRPEINNKIVVNRANQIVSFKSGYLLGEPISYVYRGMDESAAETINRLNEFVFSEEKPMRDIELVDWFYICGTSYRMALPDREKGSDAPFEIYTLDPRKTFVVYNNDLDHEPILGVKYVLDDMGNQIFSCYSKDRFFQVVNGKVTDEQRHRLGIVPIIEYRANLARLGAFELVLGLLDAINLTESNRLDGLEQFIQALMIFHNVDISQADFESLRAEGAIKIVDVSPDQKGDIKYLVANLSQGETQTLVNAMYDEVLTIVGMPNRNGGTSTSDNVGAVIFRDGWSDADARAKSDEMFFKMSEKRFIKLLANICEDTEHMIFKPSDIEIRFTRRNYENIAQKASVLDMMLNNDKIHPRLAFEHSGMFFDPDLAYKMSEEYYDEHNTANDRDDQVPAEEGFESGVSNRTGEDSDRRGEA